MPCNYIFFSIEIGRLLLSKSFADSCILSSPRFDTTVRLNSVMKLQNLEVGSCVQKFRGRADLFHVCSKYIKGLDAGA